MSKDDYDLVMSYLDEIERLLDNIAISCGHVSMKEFFSE